MDERTFGEMISELSTYFERTPPKKAVFDVWYQEIRGIPGNLNHALTAAVKQLDTWPRNLPGFLRSKTVQFQESSGEDNPYKIHDRRFHPEHYAKSNCPKCHGKGIYDFPMDWPVAKENGKLITRHVVRPALCECTEGAEYGF